MTIEFQYFETFGFIENAENTSVKIQRCCWSWNLGNVANRLMAGS